MSDFGLTRNTYEKLYVRQDMKEKVKLPIKWLAIESLQDGVFSEKTDIVSSIFALLLLHVLPVTMYH